MKLVYITGLGHSGSTLLDLLISGHDQAFSVGEAKNFNPRLAPATNCSCEVKRVLDCPFWARVGAALRTASGIGLPELDLTATSRSKFIEHNVAFYRAVQSVVGKRVIVDSSKSPSRLLRLSEAGCFDVFPIHLLRRPHGVVYSNVKKGRGWFHCALGYSKNFRRARAALRGRDHAVVRYERLASEPASVLRELMPRIGLQFDERQLEWTGRERHNCGGNRMRRSTSGDIRPDESWQDGLTFWQKTVIRVVTVRARPEHRGAL